MGNITIRQLEGEERIDILTLFYGYNFRPSPPLLDRSEWGYYQTFLSDSITLGLFDGDQLLTIATYSLMMQNIRNRLYPMAAVRGVATMPAARRQGYARQLLLELFRFMEGQDYAVSTLYAFRESFYERLGYVSFQQPRTAIFSPTVLAPLLKRQIEGKVTPSLIGDNFETFHAYLKKYQHNLHGMALAEDKEAERLRDDNKHWLAVASYKGETVGVMTYVIESPKMIIYRFFYDHSLGKYLLLEWIARHIDQVKQVELKLPPHEHPETWMADLNVELKSHDAPLGRIINITKIEGMAVGTGQISIRLQDDQCPWNNGIFRLESVDGCLKVTLDSRADCDLTMQGLSALIYGVRDPEEFSIREWGNPSPEIQKIMRQMFPPMKPYLLEMF